MFRFVVLALLCLWTASAIAQQSYPPVQSVYGYQQPTTGFSLTIGKGQDYFLLDPAGTLATGTITMMAAPMDGEVSCIASTQIVTVLTHSPNAGQTILGGIASLTVSGVACWLYRATNATWYRVR